MGDDTVAAQAVELRIQVAGDHFDHRPGAQQQTDLAGGDLPAPHDDHPRVIEAQRDREKAGRIGGGVVGHGRRQAGTTDYRR